MAAPFGAGQYEDPEEAIERRLQEEIRRTQRANAVASRLAASTTLGQYAAAARAAGPNSSFMSMLTGEQGSPYYQRQAAQAFNPRNYANAGGYTAADAVSALYGRARYAAANAAFNAAANAASPEQAFHAQFGVASGRDFTPHAAFSAYGRSPQELGLIDHAFPEEQLISSSSVTSPSHFTPQPTKPAPKPSPVPIAPKPPPTPRPREGGGGGRSPAVSGGRGGGRGRGRGGRGPILGRKPILLPRMLDKEKSDGSDNESASAKWFSGCVPLGLPDDKYWLSELQVYLRSHFAEAFGATEEDIAAPMHGRNKPIALGQVGIRCMYCKNDNPAERGQQATSYPSLISGIYNSVQQMLRLHLDCCMSIPADVRQRIEQLKLSSSSRGGRKQYWIDSAKRLGLVDTEHGIHFGRDPYGPLPPLAGPSVESKEFSKRKKDLESPSGDSKSPEKEDDENIPPVAEIEPYPLVLPDDKNLISDYLYLTLEQMQPCILMEADKVGCYKGRKEGFRGLACRHCTGQAGCGRYFPASEASLSQTTTSQTIMNHVRNCRRCPIEIRENLEIMKRARMGPDGKKTDKPKHGGRKVFFHRLWCRIQGIPFQDGNDETREKRRRKKSKEGILLKKSAKKRIDGEENDEDDGNEEDDELGDNPSQMLSSEEETETEDEGDTSDEEGLEEVEEEEEEVKQKSPSAKVPAALKKKRLSPWHEGCVRLTKTDDPHWLTEMDCFVRSDLVEVFSLKKKDSLDGYGGRKEPAVGQVGIRCIFCKSLEPIDRPTGYLVFPESLSAIHSKVGDLIRLHFPSCPTMPDEVKETFKSLRGFGAKAAEDSQQYWIDAARDIGLSDIPPDGMGSGWGVTFRRDPLQPSPADELDRENVGATAASFGKGSLVRASDRGFCTDQMMLLLRQVKGCQFKKGDRRGGPGARGRDRVEGFPGLCCKHCATKTTIGRYFPVSAKNLTDNTANSLQAHVASCSRCPEPIRASLAYLSHRSVLQKAELSGSWKKIFFKKVWDRLHVERAWNSVDDEGASNDEADAATLSSSEAHGDENNEGNGGSDAEEEKELGDHMNALIKAAAIWLTDQDNATDTASRNRAARGRGLIGNKRSVPLSSGRSKGRGGSLATAKRRKVHF